MADIDTIRNFFTHEQREILSSVWHYYLEKGEWMPTRLLHQKYGTKSITRPMIDKMGGSIISEFDDVGLSKYSLTFLGLLLSSEGNRIEALIVDYLRVAKDFALQLPLKNEMGKTDALIRLLIIYEVNPPEHFSFEEMGHAIHLSTFHNGMYISKDDWKVTLPKDIEDIPSDPRSYVQNFAVNTYDPVKPVNVLEASSAKPLDPLQISISTKEALNQLLPNKSASNDSFIDTSRIEALKSITSEQFDLTKLIEICEELNFNYSHEKWLAVTALTRALIDHIPPIFEQSDFSRVANNYPFQKSTKETMQHLENSCRKIADSHLHGQIRKKESLPTKTQVNFSHDVDVLLSEVIRVLT